MEKWEMVILLYLESYDDEGFDDFLASIEDDSEPEEDSDFDAQHEF